MMSRSCGSNKTAQHVTQLVPQLIYYKPQTLDHLEDNIRHVIADILPQMLEKVIENWSSRLDYIRASRGSPVPEIIFKISDLKNLITETTDGVAAWKILKDHFEPVTRARVIQLLDQFFGTKYQPGEDVGIFISRVKTAATRLQEAGHKLDDLYIGFQLIRWLPQEFSLPCNKSTDGKKRTSELSKLKQS
ncbi:uncharacterized protein TNCV_238341 [Trichonephila clavipes]|nr:uncharacterized protein TNCV_238341 [Trichonephila clavipes]